MPTQRYKNIEEAFQALTDLEINDDENNYPVADIKVPGLHRIKIQMVSEYDYFYILTPMREKFLNYWVNKIATSQNETNNERLLEKIKNVVNEIESVKTKEDIEAKANTLAYLFEDMKIRYEFFKNLKKMKIVKWWVSWKRYQKCMRPIDSLTVFIFLWLFNFDGVKKNVFLLFKKIGVSTSSHLPTISSSYGNWESYKKKLADAHVRIENKLKHLNN